ncbi:MAG: DUF4363 family protein [Clostridia bacterium]|nr:DUF4363 family protein [Clostridia bacterium]
MVKTVISIVIVSLMLTIGIIFENNFTQTEFKDFRQTLEVLYEKVDDHTAVEDDAYAVQENWLNKKKYLHFFIPHNEIKEFDLWLAESIKLIRDEKWEDALSKVEVLKELAEQVPSVFSLSWENIL